MNTISYVNMNATGEPIVHFWSKLWFNFQGWPTITFFAVFGPNLTFFKKIRWPDISNSYFHAKLQPILMKIEVVTANKWWPKPKLPFLLQNTCNARNGLKTNKQTKYFTIKKHCSGIRKKISQIYKQKMENSGNFPSVRSTKMLFLITMEWMQWETLKCSPNLY